MERAEKANEGRRDGDKTRSITRSKTRSKTRSNSENQGVARRGKQVLMCTVCVLCVLYQLYDAEHVTVQNAVIRSCQTSTVSCRTHDKNSKVRTTAGGHCHAAVIRQPAKHKDKPGCHQSTSKRTTEQYSSTCKHARTSYPDACTRRINHM